MAVVLTQATATGVAASRGRGRGRGRRFVQMAGEKGGGSRTTCRPRKRATPITTEPGRGTVTIKTPAVVHYEAVRGSTRRCVHWHCLWYVESEADPALREGVRAGRRVGWCGWSRILSGCGTPAGRRACWWNPLLPPARVPRVSCPARSRAACATLRGCWADRPLAPFCPAARARARSLTNPAAAGPAAGRSASASQAIINRRR